MKVGDLHMDMGDFPGKEPCPSVEWLLDGVGHRFTMVSQCSVSCNESRFGHFQIATVIAQVVTMTTSPLQVAELQDFY